MKRIGMLQLNATKSNDLKQHLLLFDEIHFDTYSYETVKSIIAVVLERLASKDVAMKVITEHEANIAYLVSQGVLKPFIEENEFLQYTSMGRIPDLESFSQSSFSISDLTDLVVQSLGVMRQTMMSDPGSLVELGQLLLAEGEHYLKEAKLQEAGQQFNRHEIWNMSDLDALLQQTNDRFVRRNKITAMIRQLRGEPDLYIPMIAKSSLSNTRLLKEKDIFLMTLRHLPIPEDDTPFEKILDFRSNSENQHTLMGLRRWMRKMATSDLSPTEAEEELAYLLNEYEKALEILKIKHHSGIAEFAIVTTLEVLENIVKLNWSTAAKKLFDINKRKVDYLIDERNLIGREVAYIVKAKDMFGNS